MTDYELKILREVSGDPQPGVSYGAATNAALEFLKENGYITGYIGMKPKLTAKGWNCIKDLEIARLRGLLKDISNSYVGSPFEPLRDRYPTFNGVPWDDLIDTGVPLE